MCVKLLRIQKSGWPRKHWPLFVALSLYGIAIFILLYLSIQQNQGQLIYPLDDSYIHMSIAKNAAVYGVWGVTRYGFTSSTSSPLWTFLLALAYRIAGVNDVLPLILNVFFGVLTISAVYVILVRSINHPRSLYILFILLAVVFVTPLPTLTVIGMEHVLHTLLTVCFVYISVETLANPINSSWKDYTRLSILAALVVASRYEGLFVVCVVCLLFWLRKKVSYAVGIGGTALMPIVLYGIWSVTQGWYFLPNSLLLKGQAPSFSLASIVDFAYSALTKILTNQHILFLLLTSLLFLFFYFSPERKIAYIQRQYANGVFVGTLLLHMLFAQTGWLYRYEAYLVLLGMVTIGIAASDLLPSSIWKINWQMVPRYVAASLLVVILVQPFGARAITSFEDTPQASNNIYEQQYQMGRFLQQFYQGQTVALNDIGAVSYLADIRLLDVWGLGSLEPAQFKLEKRYSQADVESLAQKSGVIIAIAYEPYLLKLGSGKMSIPWVRVGQWKIPNNIIAAYNTVSIYAVDPAARNTLIQNLQQFKTELPVDVQQTGEYTR